MPDTAYKELNKEMIYFRDEAADGLKWNDVFTLEWLFPLWF